MPLLIDEVPAHLQEELQEVVAGRNDEPLDAEVEVNDAAADDMVIEEEKQLDVERAGSLSIEELNELLKTSHEPAEQSGAQAVRRERLQNATSVTMEVTRSVFDRAKPRGAKLIFVDKPQQ